jgi:hypothetical protein
MDRYLVDDFIEYAMSKRGRENQSLEHLEAGFVACIVVISRV